MERLSEIVASSSRSGFMILSGVLEAAERPSEIVASSSTSEFVIFSSV